MLSLALFRTCRPANTVALASHDLALFLSDPANPVRHTMEEASRMVDNRTPTTPTAPMSRSAELQTSVGHWIYVQIRALWVESICVTFSLTLIDDT